MTFEAYATHKNGKKLRTRLLLNNEPTRAKLDAWWKAFNAREPGYRIVVEQRG